MPIGVVNIDAAQITAGPIDKAFQEDQKALAQRLVKENGYAAARVLEDGSIAVLQRLLTTWSVVLGCDEWSWRYRFCFADFGSAVDAFNALRTEEDVPDGWIACRPEVRIGNPPRYPTPDELRAMRARRGAV